MCTILKFAASQTSEQIRSTHNNAIKTGEIILFPGVRYERHVEMTAQGQGMIQPSGIVRDVLIL